MPTSSESRLQGGPGPLTVTHIHIKGCSIIEICIIYESCQPSQCVQPTCDWETHTSLSHSLSPYKMPAVQQLQLVQLPAEEQARVHPSDSSYIHTTKWCRDKRTHTHRREREKAPHCTYTSAGHLPTLDLKLQAAFQGKSRVVPIDFGAWCTLQTTQWYRKRLLWFLSRWKHDIAQVRDNNFSIHYLLDTTLAFYNLDPIWL